MIYAEYADMLVEVVEVEDGMAVIRPAHEKFPMVFVRHIGWCEQPSQTVNVKSLKHMFTFDNGEMLLPHGVTEKEMDELHKLVELAEIFDQLEGTYPSPIIYGGEILGDPISEEMVF